MNTPTIEMDRHQAAEKLRHYRKALHKKADAEYEVVAVAYEQLAKGKRLIDVADAIRQAPRDEKGRPRLAIARADRKQVRFNGWRWSRRRSTEYTTQHSGRGPRSHELTIQLDIPELVDAPEGWALVPLVPPDVRGNRSLSTHFILWEVEQWSDRAIGALADRDPYLLRHISGTLYSIEGEWDLTDVERMVTATRARDV